MFYILLYSRIGIVRIWLLYQDIKSNRQKISKLLSEYLHLIPQNSIKIKSWQKSSLCTVPFLYKPLNMKIIQNGGDKYSILESKSSKSNDNQIVNESKKKLQSLLLNHCFICSLTLILVIVGLLYTSFDVKL